MSLESSSDTVVNTLGLSPAGRDTFVGIALMSVEALRAYSIALLTPDHSNVSYLFLNAHFAWFSLLNVRSNKVEVFEGDSTYAS